MRKKGRFVHRPEVRFVRAKKSKSEEFRTLAARLARQLFTRYSLLDHSSEPRTCERVHVRYMYIYIYICMYREGGEKEGGKRCSL